MTGDGNVIDGEGHGRPWWRPVGAAFALDARSLAVYRMALGAILCADCLLRARDFDLMFAVDGIFPPDAMRRGCADAAAWSLAFALDATWWSGAVLALEGVAGALLVAGIATRWSTVAAWVAVWSVIRRTAPACAGGDAWLACQLFWSMFLPLGAAWSVDARRRAAAGVPPGGGTIRSVASAALVLQLVAVYVSAGVAKCNASWAGGGAVAHALSEHVHGTVLGTALARSGLVGDPLAWCVVALEVAGPLVLLVRPTPRVRGVLVAAFLAFHAVIGLTLTVGLFAPIGMAAWLPLVPAAAWDRGAAGRLAPAERARAGRAATWCCTAALVLAAASLVARASPRVRLPAPVFAALTATGLHQDWRMFGTVPPEERWVYARAELVDGRVVDLLRGGRPCLGPLPDGGFASLADDRWRNLCRCLGWPGQAAVAPAVAAGLARHWNATHAAEARIRALEIRHGRRDVAAAEATEHETLVASWPPRDAAGSGNLERFLESTAGAP